MGIRVLDQTQVAPGEVFNTRVHEMIRAADAVVGYVGSDGVSPFVLDELTEAIGNDKPAVAFVSSPSNGPELPQGVHRFYDSPNRSGADALIEELRGPSGTGKTAKFEV